MRIRWLQACLLGGWLLGGMPVAAQPGAAEPAPADADAVRIEFRIAWELARAGLPIAGSDSQALTDSVVYPYLEAARLGQALDESETVWTEADDAVAAFLRRHEGTPVTFNLRIVWLESLADRALHAPFLEHYRADVADTALRCRHLASRIAIDDVAGIAPPILDEWLTARQLPSVCEPVFEWLRDAGPLDATMTAARVRLLLENEQTPFARIIARRLPEDTAQPLLAWAELIENPRAAIEAHLAGTLTDVERPALLDGWFRLARDAPDAALALYARLIATEGLDAAGESEFALATALGLAWDRRPEALDFFARVDERELDDYALEWLTRAALWADERELARSAIARMSAERQAAAAWRYWAARLSEDGDAQESLFAAILPHDNYYAAVAAARLHDRVRVHPDPLEPDPPTLSRLAANPAIRRAAELMRLGLPIAANREWRFAADALTPAERAQSVRLAVELDRFDLAIATATELGIFYDYALLYPRPFPDEVAAAADEFDVEASLIYAVMRQESLYRPDAESSAGARGLMQLVPATARRIAATLDDGPGGNFDLLDPAVNIRLGTAELARLRERYDGNIVPALAAYNAGPAAADRWLPAESLEADAWLENVPFNETREYVRRVLWNSVVFEWLEDDRVHARDWLDGVRPP
jgi:soluble lytic murein transglycosylase